MESIEDIRNDAYIRMAVSSKRFEVEWIGEFCDAEMPYRDALRLMDKYPPIIASEILLSWEKISFPEEMRSIFGEFGRRLAAVSEILIKMDRQKLEESDRVRDSLARKDAKV